MLDDEDYENYVLLNSFADYIVSISDLRDASGFVREEVFRMDKNKVPINLWKILSNINTVEALKASVSYL